MTDPDRDEGSPATTTFNVLFVCTGNTCRSPMAEAIARAEAERRGWRHVRFRSAGVAAHGGEPASRVAAAVLGRHGLSLEGHRAAPADEEAVAWADLVLAMSPSHLAVLERMGGGGKAALLGSFAAGEDGADSPVPDPFGGSEETYERTFHALQRLVGAALDRLAPILHP